MPNKLVGIRLPPELDAKWRKFIQQKYQKYEQGLLSGEVIQAMQHWLKIHTDAQETLDVKPPNPMPRMANRFSQIKHFLLVKYYGELHTGSIVLDIHLREAIAETRGSDQRTIKKWLTDFATFHVIKRLSYATWELM